MIGKDSASRLTPPGVRAGPPLAAIPDDLKEWVVQVGRTLRASHNYDATIRIATRFAVPVLADLAVLILVDRESICRVEVAHADPGRERVARDTVHRHAQALLGAAAKHTGPSGTGQWLAHVSPLMLGRLANGDPELAELPAMLGVRSLLIYPLHAHGRTIGALAFGRLTERPFAAAESAAGHLLARRAAFALEDAQLHQATASPGVHRGQVTAALSKWLHVFQHASWGAAILDEEDSRLEAVNVAFATLHGLEQPADALGRPWLDFVAPAARDEVGEGLRSHPNEPHSYEAPHLRADGATFPVLVKVTPVRDDDGTVLHRSADVQDLTGIKRAEERLHRVQHMEAVGRLAGGVAHEVNNMMTIILGFSDFLLTSPDSGLEVRGDVREIRKAAARAADITRQLLAFSRQQMLEPTVLDLNAIALEAAQLLRPLLPADIHLETQLAASGGGVRADRAQLEQVIINLAFNARDAMPRGGSLTLGTGRRFLDEEEGRRRIGVPIASGSYATLRVTDTGHGMSPDVQPRIFEPFFTTKAPGKGTGLGLATVYGIVKQSGGYIWVESTVGEGASFMICLPEVALASVPTAERRTPIIQSYGNETILVVEDEDALRDVTARLLRGVGYHVLEAGNGRIALAVAERADVLDLVLTDVVMPDMGGRELREHLAMIRPELPVLYMSAYMNDEIVQRGLLGSGDAFLQKPFTPQSLTERVREALAVAGRPSERGFVKRHRVVNRRRGT